MRYELHSELEIPSSTLGRILGEFHDRAWIRRDDDVYELTFLGELLADELSALLDTVETVHQLKNIVDTLPISEMDCDLECWKEATITTASTDGVTEVIHRIVAMIQAADTVRLITRIEYDTALEDHRRAVVDGTQELEVVFTSSVLDEIFTDPDQSQLLLEILESGRAEFYSYDGTFPYVMGLFDDEYAGIGAVEAHGIPLGLVQTTDEAVCAWVADTIDHYRTQATRVSVSLVESNLS
ncbi:MULTISPECIES: winged helix-turn-helix domain-containing protein [Haloferax]|uniref:Uncharacterized protein n=2 Tax=Haloferax TaxID=2251 RepID=A0A6G1YZJ8_9EURY|nr:MULTISPECIES: hypothetical protein [Haloferax]KAB1186932.1 hypothetical protein Hfx1149_02365 [Haloferax sp. CBA1149]MRW79561.1 hypothetical protein [Haloferax marinisediminis]